MLSIMNNWMHDSSQPVARNTVPENTEKGINHCKIIYLHSGAFNSEIARQSHIIIQRDGTVLQSHGFRDITKHCTWFDGYGWRENRSLNSNSIGIYFINGNRLKWRTKYFDEGDNEVRNKDVYYDIHGNTWQNLSKEQADKGVSLCTVLKHYYKMSDIIGASDYIVADASQTEVTHPVVYNEIALPVRRVSL